MKNILIIYPHWPPSNLAGVHRARLIANFLPDFGWHPIILTVKPEFYEEPADYDLIKTVREDIEVYHVDAKKVRNPRIFGDIGIRAFGQLKTKALQIIGEKKIDFIWIPIPSFYTAIIGRILYNKTKIPYGIDYIDPWVRDISNRKNLRSIFSLLIARILEPYAIKKASIISGVAKAYFTPAIERNFKQKQPIQIAMPYGFEPKDHQIKLSNIGLPWDGFSDCIPYIYAGAFLPNSGLFIDLLFKAIAGLRAEESFNKKIKLFFIGTGNYSHKSIASYAIENKIDDCVIEIRDRFPYLHILNFLSAANGLLLIGSTEKHYTASKTFQVILSGKPVFSILHSESSAVDVFKECKAANYLVEYLENQNQDEFSQQIKSQFLNFTLQNKKYETEIQNIYKYSAKESARTLVEALEKLL
jgi:hypothetical protein